MFSKKIIMIAGLAVLVAISATLLSISGTRGVSSYGFGLSVLLVAPAQEATVRAVRFAKDIWKHYFFLVSAAKETGSLGKQLSHATEKANRCDETELSNFRLRGLLNFRETMSERVLAAEIVAKDASPWFRSVIIDKGRAEGVGKGMPVVIPAGVAGLVTDISYHHSKVMLVIDRNSAVDALVQRTRARGVVKGKSDGQCLFRYVLRKHDVMEGDVIVSSGLDGVFPKGIRVGRVSGVTKSNSDIFQGVVITPFVDFEKLEEVLVVLDPPGHDRNHDRFRSEP